VSRFQRVLRQLHFMVSGYQPPKRPALWTDRELIARQLAQRDLLGDLQPKGYRERRPIDFDDMPV
jgi:hypothetical protein